MRILISYEEAYRVYADALERAPLRRNHPTASLMRNDLLITARRAHIEQRKGYKDPQSAPKAPKREPKSRSLSETVLSDAVGNHQPVEIVGVTGGAQGSGLECTKNGVSGLEEAPLLAMLLH
jgi:hypothetical protein